MLMNAITMDEVQCDVMSLSRWVSDLAKKSPWNVLVQSFALADRALEVAAETKACMFSCPRFRTEVGCLPQTIEAGKHLAQGFRSMSKATPVLSFFLGYKFSKAALAWEDVVEDAEDIMALIEAEKDNSPLIPWETLKAELVL